MSIDQVVNLTITREGPAPTRAGFGTPLIMVHHNATAQRLALYSSVQEMETAGFVPGSKPVVLAAHAFSQDPRPAVVAIGKRPGAAKQTLEISPKNITPGFEYTFTVTDYSDTWEVSYIVLAAATTTTVATALAALIVGTSTAFTAVATAGVIKCEAAATSDAFELHNLPKIVDMTIEDITAAGTLAADLSAIEALDDSTWWSVHLGRASKAEILAAAGWTEARRKLLVVDSVDSEISDPVVTDDVCSQALAMSFARTMIAVSQSSTQPGASIGWTAGMLTTVPGAANWAYRTIKGSPVSSFTTGEAKAIKDKRANVYTMIAGLGSTQTGKVASGEFVDVVHGSDWLYARLQEMVFGEIKRASDRGSKIPYTDKGAQIIVSAVLGVLDIGVSNGFLANIPAPEASAPPVASIPIADKQNRELPDVKFSAYLAGAINAVQIRGSLSV